MASTPVASRRPATRAARPPARRRRRRRRAPGRPIGVFVLLAVLIGVGGLAHQHSEEAAQPVADQCTVTGSELTFTPEQTANAATIAAVARARGLPVRATTIALATGQQESRLRNLDYGDRDSLGLFQQRPSQGWGSAEQVRDPVYAAGAFFDRLVEVPDWQNGRLTEVAQAVQRSGFPEAYQQWEPMATALAGALQSATPTALSCSVSPAADLAPVADRTAALTAAARREAGAPTVEADGVVSVAGAGWPEASWAVAHAERFGLSAVSLDGWRWTTAGGWESSPAAFALPLQLRLA